MKGYRILLFMLALLASAGMKGQYNPTNPAEPGASYTLTLQATPDGAGSFNVSSGAAYSEGTNISLRAYNRGDFVFTGWEEDGEVISTSSSFTYTMPARSVKLVAHFKYDPDSPAEPPEPDIPVYSALYLSASPSGSGSFNISSGNRYEVGSSVNLRAYNRSDFTFVNWTENGEVISTSSSFNYVVKEGDANLVANFDYTPDSPGEPSEPRLYHKLFVQANPAGGGYFNVQSGNSYQEGSEVNLWAYSNQWYTFVNWTRGGEVVSTSYIYRFTMPDEDLSLVANYTYNYDPDNPADPSEPPADNVNIYGMTENGVCGQTITYPVYLENPVAVTGMVVDLQFPAGFTVGVGGVALAGRASGHELEVTALGDNNYRFSLLGADAFDGNNGKVFDVPVTIPDTATMGRGYPVALTHGVMHAADGSQTPIAVRSGAIYVEKTIEDGLYAKFSYDKLQGRVKFTNLSSGNATGYLWDFGDGQTSTERSPLHVYAEAGYYNVKLTVQGDVDSDVAEMTVVVNDKASWKVDGTFYLSDEESGVRYFTTADALFSFIGSASISGDVRVGVKAGGSFDYPMDAAHTQTLASIFTSLASGGHKFSFYKWGEGSNPSLNVGEQGGQYNPAVVSAFVANGSLLSCDGVELRLWGIGFNPSLLYQLQDQAIHSGEKTSEIDFSAISADLTFEWSLAEVPAGVTGCVAQGTRSIPAMTIVNEGQGTCRLVYDVKGVRGGDVFCQFTVGISVTPALVGLFTSLSPADGTVSESTTVTLTWNSITNAVYDVYLWNAANARPARPVAEGLQELRFTSQGFCQNGNTYKWQVVARGEAQQLASDTMSFSVSSLPDLHVYALDCSEAVAGEKMTVQWTVRNDGAGTTGDVQWNDYVWLVTDVYGGTQPSNDGLSTNNATLLATVKNVKSLAPGESYESSVDVTLAERVYGNHYIIVASDMYNVTDIGWSAVGGSVINPYNPSQDGSTGYKHLFATTSASYNKVYEQGETTTSSDNFFYKKIDIAVPDLADLQVPAITAIVMPTEDPEPSAASAPMAAATRSQELTVPWKEAYVPSPITAAGLRHTTSFYSGKKVAVSVTVANKGGMDTGEPFSVVLYMSHSADRDAEPLTTIASLNCPTNIAAGRDTTLVFAFYLPYEWHGDTYFHAIADPSDAVYELANKVNNWGVGERIDVLLCPGADFVPSGLTVPKAISSSAQFNVSYKVENRGSGVPFVNAWTDKIFISKKNTGLDDTAVELAAIDQAGYFQYTVMGEGAGGNVLVEPEKYTYVGDDYEKTVAVTPKGITSGTYYIYVQANAGGRVYEYDGEANNVVCSGTLTFVQPDLTAELVSISDDTLATGRTVAFTWKLKNTGTGDISNAKVTDAFYASVNQDGSSPVLIGRAENTVWIAAGQEKTLRANITVPSDSRLNGLRYIFVKANDDGALQEESTGNNASPLLRSWCKYYTEPQPPVVPGVNLYIDRFDAPASCKPGVASTLTYTLRNTGDADLGDVEATHEVFISDSRSFSAATATPCEVTVKGGSTRNLKAGHSVDFTLSFTVPVTQQGGDKFVYVVVDRANAIGEREVGDNRAYSAIRIDGNLPDLGVEALSVPDTIMTSVATPVSFAVANTGQWRASAFTLSVYLSADNAYDRNDLLLATIPVNGLHRGASVDCPAEVSVADDKPGKWYLIAVAEGRDDDLDRANNTVAVPVTVEQSVLPDLRVEALSLGGTLTAGQKATVRATVANVGAHATRTDKWADTYYLSTSAVLNTATATQVGSKAHVGTLAEAGRYDSEVTLNIPPTMQGNYMLFAVTDAADGVTEADENNNARSLAVYVNGAADTPAELTVTDVQAPATITAGADVTLSYTLRNGGAFAVEGELSDVIYLSADDKWDVSDQMVGVARTEVNIEPGGALTRTVTGRITNMPEGDYYLIVKANSTRSVAETDYDDNTAVAAAPCRLAFEPISLGQTVAVNTSGYYKLDVTAGYEGKAVGLALTHPEEAAAGVYAAYGAVPSTARYDHASTSLLAEGQELLLPDVKAGTYYILAQDNSALAGADANLFVEAGEGSASPTPMTLAAREVPFGATSLSIAEGGNGGWVSTDVRGALFDSIMDFRLKLAEKVIPAETVTYDGMTSSRVTFNLNDADAGTYDVVSELPSGEQATLPAGFRVVPGTSVALGAKIDVPNLVRVGNYAPLSISYANGGNTDCVIYRLMLVIDNGYLGTSIQDLDRHQSVLYLDLGTKSDSRGYTSIPPGEQRTLNLFMYQTAASSTLTVYVVQ